LTEKLEYAKLAKATPHVMNVTAATGLKKNAASIMKTVWPINAKQLKYRRVSPVVRYPLILT